ncbi:thermonuclease family protein [Helicobacter turcicus]|uniref:Thermonuclease family protein n=1 Tax=Helicobacter turcicus TaxID=2867412 RepID=A0ABS7JQA1_9HELI|nr:thermonuclease family protein [Helicobacter turcicus]MBX7491532.1 thermonuclease family protein [Helicobacter turcicus]MBX7546388.1 thermonuclease family protein [Helicobacter turcicus]
MICRLKILLLVGILSVLSFGFSIPPVSMQVLMKHIFAPTLFSAYSKDYGMMYCQLYGVAGVSKSFKWASCEITSKAFREMRHFAMQYVQNKIELEQQYRLGYKNGWCFLQRGGNLFNAEVVRDGYAVVQHFDLSEEKTLNDLEQLETIARNEKRGLWKEWGQEMQCLKTALGEIAQVGLKESLEKSLELRMSGGITNTEE